MFWFVSKSKTELELLMEEIFDIEIPKHMLISNSDPNQSLITSLLCLVQSIEAQPLGYSAAIMERKHRMTAW